MVVTRLTGGLGNQMFQYAVARALALRNGTELKIDTHFYAQQHLHRYELHVYPVSCSFVTDDELFRFGIRNAKKRRFYQSFVYRNWKVVKERHFHFDPTIKLLNSPVYLAGYWQSERYFHEVGDILRTEFCPSDSLEPHTAQIAADIQAVNAVSVHVRRGDYVINERTNRLFGTCSLDYYRRAAEFVAERVDSPHFFVFSDEPQWARTHLRFEFPTTYVIGNSGFRDLQLMSRCRHHIIANSSFSWWGAWLNASPDKIVVAPRAWFNELQHNTQDLIPEAWVRM
jgi:hypothetical protein